MKKLKSKFKSEKSKMYREKLDKIMEQSTEKNKKLLEINCERGASLWLSTLPIKDKGFQIDKQSFWDLLKIRYSHQVDRLPRT